MVISWKKQKPTDHCISEVIIVIPLVYQDFRDPAWIFHSSNSLMVTINSQYVS